MKVPLVPHPLPLTTASLKTTTRLLSLATQQNLEAWWYPLWTYRLSVYTVNYGRNPNLSIAPQPSIEKPGSTRYLIPDFAIIETRSQQPFKELQLVMEVRRRENALTVIQARLKTREYLKWAVRNVNNPNQAGVYGIAATGGYWRFCRLIPGAGPGGRDAFTRWSIGRTPHEAFSDHIEL